MFLSREGGDSENERQYRQTDRQTDRPVGTSFIVKVNVQYTWPCLCFRGETVEAFEAREPLTSR